MNNARTILATSEDVALIERIQMPIFRACFLFILLCTTEAVAQNATLPIFGYDFPRTVAAGPICTDRPTKANVVCTVPKGYFQIESDVVNWTRIATSGGYSDVTLYANATLKYGLTDNTDLQVNIAPYAVVSSRVDGIRNRLDGVSDLIIRLKQKVTAPDAEVQVALIPYIKAPTAQPGIGNNRWEGGVIAPIIFPLPEGFYLNFGPQIDVLADLNGRGYHTQLTGLANLSKSFGPLTLYAELWTSQNFDPSRVVRQVSADFAATYLINSEWQIDIGSNFGLNSATPDAQVYLGISTRF